MEDLSKLIDVHYEIEKMRIAAQLRLNALKKQEREDDTTREVYERLVELEKYLEKQIALKVIEHPVWEWAKYVKGISPNLAGKVIGRCDIKRISTIGKMKAHSGLAPGQGLKKGRSLNFDSELKHTMWVIGKQLKLVRGKYYEFYLKEKDRIHDRELAAGKTIVPSSELTKDAGGKRRDDFEGLVSYKRIDNLATRKMMALFMSNLWQVWREAEGMPARAPYAQEYLGHNGMIDPWSMVDRKAGKIRGKGNEQEASAHS